MSEDHPLAISIHHGITVVRDDAIPGGTKTRAIDTVLEGTPRHVGYAGPAYGYAQIALAHGARAHGRTAHVFVAKRKRPHPHTLEAAEAGARIHEVSPGYLTQTTATARAWAASNPHDRVALPFGFDSPAFAAALTQAILAALPTGHSGAPDTLLHPREVWVAAGTGTVTRVLQAVWPDADHHAVLVGKRDADTGTAHRHLAPEPFERDTKTTPPYPSVANYDAKVWQFAQDRGAGTLIWNVAG